MFENGVPGGDPQESDRGQDASEQEAGERVRGAARATSLSEPTSPSARARMISVAACEPELPPLEMISGTKRASTTVRAICGLEEAHGRGREHLADEQDDQPARALAHHGGQRRAHVRLVERLQAAEALDVAGRFLLGHVDARRRA